MYLDENGDPGLKNSPTKHYILAGFSVHHGDWQALEVRLREFRVKMATRYGYPAEAELHASELLGASPFKHIGRSDWLVGHPVGLSSRDDNMIQVADLIAYMVRQKFSPNRHALTNGYVTLCDKLLPTSLGWKQID